MSVYKFLDATGNYSNPATTHYKYLRADGEWATPSKEYKFLRADGEWAGIESVAAKGSNALKQ